MTLGNDPMQETPLTLKERRPFSLLLTCEKQDKSRLDLTGCALSLVIADVKRKGGDVKVTKAGELVSATDGTARFDLQASELNFGTGTYDLTISLTTDEGFTSSIVEGPVTVTHNPDPAVPADFSVVVPPLGLTARFRNQNRVTVRVNHHPDTVLLDAAARAETAASSAQLATEQTSSDRAAAFNSAAAAAQAAQNAAAGAASVEAAQANALTTITGARDDAVADVNAAGDVQRAALLSDAQDYMGQLDAQGAQIIADAHLAATGIVNVEHGDDGNMARPAAAVVHWIGLATPVNAQDWDFWTRSNL